MILPGFTDSRHFRTAFPDCVAYGFFPHRHQSLLEAAPLVHGADERIDVRDLGFAELYAISARCDRSATDRSARASDVPQGELRDGVAPEPDSTTHLHAVPCSVRAAWNAAATTDVCHHGAAGREARRTSRPLQ